MERRTLILLLLCGVVTIADGYPNGGFTDGGLGTSACSSGPLHPGSPQNSLAPVAINAVHAGGNIDTTYTAGETLTGIYMLLVLYFACICCLVLA